jgi:selenide,water dikinase
MEEIKLTQFSPGSGCGCKISPKDLEEILNNINPIIIDNRLLVGNSTKDDAAVFDLGNGQAIISTTDFFTPIVDDAFEYGYIAAINALSDIYAMGGTPILAIAILGWPLSKIPANIAKEVIKGATEACAKAGITISGGHSIDIPVPIFGLAVNGLIPIANIKKNCSAKPNCSLFITKPLGIGILSTAQKKNLLTYEDLNTAINSMKTLNSIGAELGKLNCVIAMTDVTGFGLGGHLIEMCEGSNVNAEIDFNSLPIFNGIEKYIDNNTIPGGTSRNFNSYGNKISTMTEFQKLIICDPQTSGGLLIAVETENEKQILQLASTNNLFIKKIGRTIERNSKDDSQFILIK